MPDKPIIKSLKNPLNVRKGERETGVPGKQGGLLAEWSQPERLKWLILPLLSLLISILLFPNVLEKPRNYRAGDVSERDVKATHDFLVENKALTQQDRERAAKGVLSVYDFDRSSSNVIERIREAFALGRQFSRSISSDAQAKSGEANAENALPDNLKDETLLRNRFFEILEIQTDPALFTQLRDAGFSAEIEDISIQTVLKVFGKGVVGDRALFEGQMEKGGIILHEINTQNEIEVTNKDRFYDLEGARSFVENQIEPLGEKMGTPESAAAAVKLILPLIKPNLTFNQRETELRKDLVKKSVKPTYIMIKKGEMLVREGERIGPEHLAKLSEATQSRSRYDMLGRIPAMAILIGLFFAVMYVVGSKGDEAFRRGGRDLVFDAVSLLAISIFIWAFHYVAEQVARGFPFFTARALTFAMPIAFGAMLISIFQGVSMAVTFSLVLSILASLIIGGRAEFFMYFFVSSLVAAYGVRSCHERGILIKAGLKVGLINMVLSLSIEAIYHSLYSLEALIAVTSAFVGGVLAGVIATGILPLVEMAFGFTTDIKLLELANLDQPLLRELMVQAPGTYHHSVIISNMVEATAKAVKANPLLARVSAYYHDLGKMKKPLYFIENQMGGENRHAKLAPSMSSLILISHVKDGSELAKQHKVGREITDIIQQHHGTSLISYFYQKALERAGKKGGKATEVKEEDFRYPGPKPQTKEAGLVMLADIVEAASRSVVDPTPSRIQGVVQKIINKAFSDGQLDECELTLKDLHEIAKSFNKTLSGIFHHRVEYPETTGKGARKVGDGHPDHMAKEDSRARKPEDKAETEEGLKRLGLS
jgi:putative nucleotidyltransferase with HDIG domain